MPDIHPERSAATRFAGIVCQISYPGFGFEVSHEGPNHFLRVTCDSGKHTRTGEPYAWSGRKWRLSEHMTDGEIVQTAFLAMMTALEHEARELFTFQGVSVFDPHYDIYKLVELRASADAIKEREPA